MSRQHIDDLFAELVLIHQRIGPDPADSAEDCA
jgi:hypothetical protein